MTILWCPVGMTCPSWFSRRYPTLADLELLAHDLGAVVARTPLVDSAYIVQIPGALPVVILPEGLSPLDEMWQLAHELAHLVLHPDGYLSPWTYSRQEAQAERWAARALIPEAAVRRHRNASLDAFIGALSAHYEELPLADCASRRLAAHIAAIRLKAVEEVA